MARSRSAPAVPSAAFATLLATATVLFTATSHSSDGTLISIDRRQSVEVQTAELSQMTVIQELANSWLVEVPSALVPRLRARGVSFSVLEDEAENPVRYLIFGQTAEQIEQAGPLGRVHLLDAGVGLLSCDRELPRDLLPADVSVKLLSGPIATPLSFQLTGERRAAVRQGLTQREVPYNPRIADMVGGVSQQTLSDEILDLRRDGRMDRQIDRAARHQGDDRGVEVAVGPERLRHRVEPALAHLGRASPLVAFPSPGRIATRRIAESHEIPGHSSVGASECADVARAPTCPPV